MPVVNGSLKNILGQAMGNKQGELKFYLAEPGVHASIIEGEVNPTAFIRTIPDSTGNFSADLRSTDTMLNDNFYRMRIEWLEDGLPPMDFPNWEIRVPFGTGPYKLSDLITIGSPGVGPGGANAKLWWVSLDPPPRMNYVWLYLDPDDPDRETGPNPDLTLGDIVTRWW